MVVPRDALPPLMISSGKIPIISQSSLFDGTYLSPSVSKSLSFLSLARSPSISALYCSCTITGMTERVSFRSESSRYPRNMSIALSAGSSSIPTISLMKDLRSVSSHLIRFASITDSSVTFSLTNLSTSPIMLSLALRLSSLSFCWVRDLLSPPLILHTYTTSSIIDILSAL